MNDRRRERKGRVTNRRRDSSAQPVTAAWEFSVTSLFMLPVRTTRLVSLVGVAVGVAVRERRPQLPPPWPTAGSSELPCLEPAQRKV